MTDKKLPKTYTMEERLEKLISGYSNTGDLSGECYPMYGVYDLVEEFINDELAKARAEERERIADEFGDFRLVAKGWLGIIKYGRTLRFFLLPHTKHKKGDDESNE